MEEKSSVANKVIRYKQQEKLPKAICKKKNPKASEVERKRKKRGEGMYIF